MLESFLYPVLTVFFTGLFTWLFAMAKNKRDLKAKDISNESDSLDIEIKAADYYDKLLGKLDNRLNDLSNRHETLLNELTRSEENNRKLMKINGDLIESNTKLLESNNHLVEELQKFKQLNGKAK